MLNSVLTKTEMLITRKKRVTPLYEPDSACFLPEHHQTLDSLCKIIKTSVPLEFMVNTALLHNGICCMAGFYLCIDGYMAVGDWAVPYIMVAFSTPFKNAAILGKYVSYLLFIFCHYKTILSWRSDRNDKEMGRPEDLFKESNSGTAMRTRSNKASNEPDSSTRPGISSLVAIQTHASLSQTKFTTYSI